PEPASSPCQAPADHWEGKPEPDPATPSLTLLVLKTPDVDALRAFYQAFGLTFIQEQHGNGPVHYAARIGEAVMDVYPLLTGEADKTTRLGFTVADLSKVIADLKTRSVEVKEPAATEWGLRVVVRDPDGRAVELYQRSRRS